jgi:hypothetical protein
MVSAAIETICDMVEHARLRLDDIGPVATTPTTNLELIQQAAEVADESELLWSTPELVHFANEAIKEVALRTRCIRDSEHDEANVTTYAWAADVTHKYVDQRVLEIKRAFWVSTGNPTVILTPDSEKYLDEQVMDNNQTLYQSVYANTAPNWRTEPVATPTRYVVSRESRVVRMVGVPSIAGTLQLDVVRLPLEAIEVGIPEIPQHFLSDCLDWMCHLAYLKNDADTYDPTRSERYAKEFERKVGPRPTDHRLICEYQQSGRRRPRGIYF